MRYLTFTQPEKSKYPICFLVPTIRKDDILNEYINPFKLNQEEVLVIDLHYVENVKKTPVSEMKRYIQEELVSIWQDLSVEYLVVSDGDYFKALTGAAKVEANLGYVMPCAYGPQLVVYVPNTRAIFYDPDKVRQKISQGITAMLEHRNGVYQFPGGKIIHFAEYPQTDHDIAVWLDKLIKMDVDLTCDIEGFSLSHIDSGIATITFCWNKHEGIAFPIDYLSNPLASEAPFGEYVKNEPRRKMLRDFFLKFKRKMIYHSISHDVKVLIYTLFMKDILDTEGLLDGLDVMLRDWDCTKLITYLATNSCAGNRLGLKVQAQEYAGNYAQDDEAIKDIRRIPLPQLLEYNLVDGISTWYVHEKHYPTMVADQQLEIYETLFQPAMLDIIQMQLTGMPVNMKRAIEVNEKLTTELDAARTKIMNNPIVKQFTKDYLDVEHVQKRNEKLKTKQIKLGDEPQEFNPNSDLQKRALLFTWLNLPVINLTESKQPSTDGETVEALLNRVTDPDTKNLLEAFQLFNIIDILTTNFMPSILGAVQGPDGWHYLFGNFNLGGTLSGRLSSSGPNLQNLPSTGKGHKLKLIYAKLIKSCFAAPPGWFFAGVDFASLEDRISALTTKDPNKLKVYTDGYDGHSLRAFAYFGDQMPDIIDTVESINTIQKKYKPLRDRSKNPTFTLTYQGTWIALVKKYGFTEEQAKEVERKYHVLYKVSDDWVNARLDQAMTDGYITAAFGLRLRTPLLKQVIRGNSKTPYEAEAEGRTAGNALGQSWCLLNSRAWVEFMGKVRKSEFRLAIRPCAQIHDAGYALIRDDIRAVMYMNEHLIKAVQWQEHPDIAHDEVKLGGELGIFYPDWNTEITIPNGASENEIFSIFDKALAS